jgi:hypothetical protein
MEQQHELYVVRKSFKSAGIFYAIGSLIEDLSVVKLAKIKVNEGKIRPVPSDEEGREALCHFYLTKLGVNLAEILAEGVSKGSISAATEITDASVDTTPPGTPDVDVTSTDADPIVPNDDSTLPDVDSILATGGIVSNEVLLGIQDSKEEVIPLDTVKDVTITNIMDTLLNAIPAAQTHQIPDTTPKVNPTVKVVTPPVKK